jgi:hypothetical protein
LENVRKISSRGKRSSSSSVASSGSASAKSRSASSSRTTTRSGSASSRRAISATLSSSPVGSLGLHSATRRVRSLTALRIASTEKPLTGTATPRAWRATTGYSG